MFIRRFFLFPFAVVYNAITRVRNHLFDIRLKPSVSFDVPILSVGNLSVGGTGKTPMVEHIIWLLQSKFNVATLSRGYGRKTKGMRIANEFDTALTLGDEPFQIFEKFKDQVVVAVGEERALAIPHILHQFPNVNTIILDDAFQHRYVKPGFSILLTEYSNPFYLDYLLPAGNLRESRDGADRANVIVVTKCPNHLSSDEMISIEHAIRKYAEHPIFFAKIRYGTPTSFTGNEGLPTKKVILLTGIANAQPLQTFVGENYELVKHYNFKDHHVYTTSDLQVVIDKAKNENAIILTTEKDKTKLYALANEDQLELLYFLPIELEFLKNGFDFDAIILEFVKHPPVSVTH